MVKSLLAVVASFVEPIKSLEYIVFVWQDGVLVPFVYSNENEARCQLWFATPSSFRISRTTTVSRF